MPTRALLKQVTTDRLSIHPRPTQWHSVAGGNNYCSTNLWGDALNCGSCGLVCPAIHATPMCASGTCAIAGCNAGYADCNAQTSDGCETAVNADVNNCGSCGLVCTATHATSACSSGMCAISSCNAGFADCDASIFDGCEVNVNTDINHCGSCGVACSMAHAIPMCASGVCAIASCDAGYANCDLYPGNGCETSINGDVNNCGSCNHICSTAHATPTCSFGACAIASCSAGYADCDASVPNGCEVSLASDKNNCGAFAQSSAPRSVVQGGARRLLMYEAAFGARRQFRAAVALAPTWSAVARFDCHQSRSSHVMPARDSQQIRIPIHHAQVLVGKFARTRAPQVSAHNCNIPNEAYHLESHAIVVNLI